MSKEKLKPCPFCGGEAMFNVNSNKSTHYSVGFSFGIKCSNCKLILPQTFKAEFCMTEQGEINTIADERKEAIETWNGRADNGK